MSELDTIGTALGRLEMSNLSTAPLVVPAAIASLAGVPAPKGDSDAVQLIADAFGKACGPIDQVAFDMENATQRDLPEVWVGRTGDLAGDVMVAVTEDIKESGQVFDKAKKILANLSAGFADAHRKFGDAQDPLRRAVDACEHKEYETARSLGRSAGEGLAAAYLAAAEASRVAVRDLEALTDQARAHAMNTGNLDNSDKLVLAESAIPDGAHNDNLILSESEAQRAAQRLDGLSDADRKRMEDLLTHAKSPQERAYLMKTLAAGHSVDEVSKFGELIHGHGDDPKWLEQKLTPIVTQTQSASVEYQDGTFDSSGKPNAGSWTQGAYPTCVASSTVMARAMVDPAYALSLTTGNKPDDPASTSKDAFLRRLRDEQATTYDHGRDEGSLIDKAHQLFGADGMYPDEGRTIANEDIGRYTGQTYDLHDLGNAGDRRNVLPDIERAVDQGQPVPFQVNGNGGHQMLVIGHKGDQLEIYNPWGNTGWISEDAFINGHVNDLPGPDQKPQTALPPNVGGVLLPH